MILLVVMSLRISLKKKNAYRDLGDNEPTYDLYHNVMRMEMLNCIMQLILIVYVRVVTVNCYTGRTLIF